VQKSSHKTVLGTVWEDCNSQKKFALLIFLGGSSIECGGRPLQRRLTRRQNDYVTVPMQMVLSMEGVV
jgi:hypothetical protein